jgi:tyrosine-protein kinase Etk/Wzc
MTRTALRPSQGFVDTTDANAVALRNLRTTADLVAGRRGGVALMFTSPNPGEGTSTIASNHALLASDAGRSTLLIDANLSRPALHTRLRAERRPGLTEIAAGLVSLERAVRPVKVGSVELDFLPAGAAVHGSVDVIGSQSVTDLVTDACRSYDTVVIDSPPVLALTDAAVLAAHPEVDTIVVVGHRQRRKRATQTIRQLRRAGANIIGVAVNSG